MSTAPFSASLHEGEAVLRFPYDEDLRRTLRALPGRRWDPVERAWRVPVREPEQARALRLLLDALPARPLVSEELARTLGRALARRGAAAARLSIDAARPDEEWWLTFPLDGHAASVMTLLGHPQARQVPPLGLGLVPADAAAEELLACVEAPVSLSERARRALAARERPPAPPAHDVQLRHDRGGRAWIVVAPALAGRLTRTGVLARETEAGQVGLAAEEADADAIAAQLTLLPAASVDPRVRAWLRRARTWRGTIDVGLDATGQPALLLLGDAGRLPRTLREVAQDVHGGAAVPLAADTCALVRALAGWPTPAARRCLEAVCAGRPAPAAVLALEESWFVLRPGHDATRAHAFAALPGVQPPRARDELGRVRADAFCVAELDDLLADGAVWVEPDALAQLMCLREQHARAAGLVELSRAADGELDVPGLGGELKPFQRAGVAYLLARRRAFLADEQGLGKTIQALATLEADDAYPAIVVCPASLKLNWLRELARWLPGRTARALGGGGAGGGGARRGRVHADADADVFVVNYDVLARRLDELCAFRPRALVLDESHLCKNPAAKRTQAAQRLAAAVPPGGLVLALTGTPVTNRPGDLVAQLRILGRLHEFGSGASFGARFRGADAHVRLHWHLRARCLARRLKADVLPQLPAKTRAIVPIELDNEAEYRLAERDVIAWLQTQPYDLRELDAKVVAALRAERLVRLSALKQLAARGKLRRALAWIHDFCTSGERLVVFARHRDVQQALLAHFPRALHVLGEDTLAARERAVRAFQEPDGNQLIVCSLEVAGAGLTLTRASNVAFLELDWTPAKHDQAEDRCHRIGQEDAVTAYYLLAAGTVDESIATLLERKRAVIGAVTDGRAEDEEGVVDALVRELRGEAYRHLRAVA